MINIAIVETRLVIGFTCWQACHACSLPSDNAASAEAPSLTRLFGRYL